MESKQIVQVGLIAVALTAAGFFIWKNSAAFSSENPEITTRETGFLCDQCKEGFQVSVGESRAYKVKHQTDVPCPKCGSAKVFPAFKCPACSTYFLPVGHGTPPKKCPSCKAPVPPDIE